MNLIFLIGDVCDACITDKCGTNQLASAVRVNRRVNTILRFNSEVWKEAAQFVAVEYCFVVAFAFFADVTGFFSVKEPFVIAAKVAGSA